jgi:hypothetical protein
MLTIWLQRLDTGLTVWISNPGGGRIFSPPHSSRLALGSTQLPLQWVPGLFPGVERYWRGVGYLSLSSYEVRNELSCIYTIPLCLQWYVTG